MVGTIEKEKPLTNLEDAKWHKGEISFKNLKHCRRRIREVQDNEANLDYVQHKENQNVIEIFNREMNYINL